MLLRFPNLSSHAAQRRCAVARVEALRLRFVHRHGACEQRSAEVYARDLWGPVLLTICFSSFSESKSFKCFFFNMTNIQKSSKIRVRSQSTGLCGWKNQDQSHSTHFTFDPASAKSAPNSKHKNPMSNLRWHSQCTPSESLDHLGHRRAARHKIFHCSF